MGAAAAQGLLNSGGFDVLIVSSSGRRVGLDGARAARFDANLANNSDEQMDHVRSFNPHVVVLAFGSGMNPRENLRDVVLTNTGLPLEVVAWLHAHTDCRSFVQVGTCFEYGPPRRRERLAESSPPQPFNVYGCSKFASCLALEDFSSASGSQMIYLRPFTLFGPGEAPARLAPTIFDAFLEGTPAHFSSGLQSRDFVYAADLADFFLTLVKASGALPQWDVLNVCSGRRTRIKDFVLDAVEIIHDRFNREPPQLFFDRPSKWKNEPASVVGDPTYALDTLGWACGWEFQDAVCDYFERYRRQRATEAKESTANDDQV